MASRENELEEIQSREIKIRTISMFREIREEDEQLMEKNIKSVNEIKTVMVTRSMNLTETKI